MKLGSVGLNLELGRPYNLTFWRKEPIPHSLASTTRKSQGFKPMSSGLSTPLTSRPLSQGRQQSLLFLSRRSSNCLKKTPELMRGRVLGGSFQRGCRLLFPDSDDDGRFWKKIVHCFVVVVVVVAATVWHFSHYFCHLRSSSSRRRRRRHFFVADYDDDDGDDGDDGDDDRA